jgi:hypothetical protein
MGLLLGLLAYLIAAVAIVGSAAAFLLSIEPAVTMAPAQQQARKVAPRVQAWLDRNAEGLVYSQKEKAAASAEKERADARRMKIPSTAELAAFARARTEERQAAERESPTRTKENAKRDGKRRSGQLRNAERSGLPRVAQERSLQYYPDLHGRSH